MSGDLTDVIDALRTLLEPTPIGVTVDVTLAEPPTFQPATFYAWPLREVFVEDGVDLDKHEFTVRVAFGADRGGEVDDGDRDRAVSLAIQAKVSAYRTAVRLNRSRGDQLWNDIHVDAVDYAPLRGFQARGFFMDIAGYSYNE